MRPAEGCGSRTARRLSRISAAGSAAQAAGGEVMAQILRLDLTDYRPYLEALRDRLNKDGLYTMTLTDVAKIGIERLMESYAPDVVVNKTRRKYERLNF